MARKGSGARLSWSSLAEELAASWQQNNDDNHETNRTTDENNQSADRNLGQKTRTR